MRLLHLLSAGVAFGTLVIACSSGGSGSFSETDTDGGVRPDANLLVGDGGGACPANPPSGACSVQSKSCNYTCTSCQCIRGTWDCESPGCASSPAEIVLRVIDHTTQSPVRGPTFTESGTPIPFECEGGAVDAGAVDAAADVQDAGIACAAWRWTGPPAGPHSVVVGAPGYAETTITVEATLTQGGCCGPQGERVERDVELTP